MTPAAHLLAALLLAAPTAPASPPEGFLHARGIEVEAPGRVRVRLDAHALAHGLPGESWRVFGPDGEAVPQAVLAQKRGSVTARSLSVEEDAHAWRILFDLGPTPFLHRVCHIVPAEPMSVRGVRIEGSLDGSSWEPLAEGDLFRLGYGDDLTGTTLSYPPTDARYLRLTWPGEAGLPELVRVAVEAMEEPAGGAVSVELDLRPLDPAGRAARYRLGLPLRGLRPEGLELRGESLGPVGFRLLRPDGNRWTLVREGTLETLREGAIPLLETPALGEVVRLDLHGTGGRGPRLDGAAATLPPRWLLFDAREAGRHTLAYRPDGEPTGTAKGLPQDPDRVPSTDARLGPVETAPPPALPDRIHEPGREIESAVVGGWRVVAKAARPGEVVRLELPDEAYEESDGLVGRLHLVADGREVPYLAWSHPEPVKVMELRGLEPTPSGREGRGELVVELPLPPQCLGQLELTTTDAPFRQPVRTQFRWRGQPGRGPFTRVDEWRCDETPGLPCRMSILLGSGAALPTLRLRFEDEGEPAPDSVDVTVWRDGGFFVFVWPDAADVRLVRLYEAGAPPSQRLWDFRNELMRSPWKEARLDLEGSDRREQDRERLWKGALIAALLLAGAALLLFVGRGLLSRGGGSG